MTIRDQRSGWTDGYPPPSKSTTNVRETVQDFEGSEKIDHWYSDGAGEIHAACREEGTRHDKSDPNRHETNRVIERTNRTVIEGTRTVLFQSGLPHKYLREAMKCFCCLCNFNHKDAPKGTIPLMVRHNQTFKGMIMQFGAKIYYTPSAAREVDELQQIASNLKEGLFMGYDMHSGGLWKGSCLIIDKDRYCERKEEHNFRAYVHSVAELYPPGSAADDKECPISFPVADGLWREARAPNVEDPGDSQEPMPTDAEEAVPSALREVALAQESTEDANHPGEEIWIQLKLRQGMETFPGPSIATPGRFRVTTWYACCTTLFTPLEVIDTDPPPVPMEHLEVTWLTKPEFGGPEWDELKRFEDCWTGRSTDAKS